MTRGMSRIVLVVLVLGLTGLWAGAGEWVGGPGELDTTFGGNGTGMFYDPANFEGSAYAMARQSISGQDWFVVVSDSGYVMQLNAAGTTLGAFPKVVLPIDVPSDVAVDELNRIVVVGRYGSSSSQFGVVRLTPNGALDSSFGSGGLVTTAIGNLGSAGMAVAIDTNAQKIVVSGYSYTRKGTAFAVARYNYDGSLDSTFGPQIKKNKPERVGYVVDDIDSKASDQPWPGLIALQQHDGQTKILVGGWTGGNPVTGPYVITRYTAAGEVDGNFAASGRLYVSFAGSDHTQLWGLAVTQANQIIAGGRVYFTGTVYSYDAFVARYTADGALDPSFGSAGLARSYLEGEDNGGAVVVQPDGKIVIACNFATGTFPPDEADLMVFRWNADGTTDNTFGPYLNGRSESASTGIGDLNCCIQLTSAGDILISSRPFAVTKYFK